MAMKSDREGQQPGSSMFFMFIMLFLILIIFMNPALFGLIGSGIGYALNPVIGFGGSLPLITILFASMIMSFISTSIRHYFIDWIDVARSQKIMGAFNKARREALMSKNTAKLEKLNKMQPEIMKKSLKSSTGQLKPMMFTMIIIILFFAWLSTFVYMNAYFMNFSVPWNFDVPLTGTYIIFPYWIFLYMVASIPFGMIFQRVLKYYSFKNKLLKMKEDGLISEKKYEEKVLGMKKLYVKRERAATNFICTICGKKVRKGSWAYKCKCGKYYHLQCSSEFEKCPTCGSILAEAEK
jgi:uncharacterized membrane protein (DUF106 family)/predicted RNA-binding Zn-ribbon protein involved in translation (DUF1610 family)